MHLPAFLPVGALSPGPFRPALACSLVSPGLSGSDSGHSLPPLQGRILG